MRVVLIASELQPFTKSGGLADVVGALAVTLAGRGHEVVTVSPRARGVAAGALVGSWSVIAASQHHEIGWQRVQQDGVTHLLIDQPMFQRPSLYGYDDDAVRFSVLCRAALAAVHQLLGWSGQMVVHVHDWQAALVPVMLEASYRPLGLLTQAATVLTVHNLAHQGWFGPEVFGQLDLAPRWAEPWALGRHGAINLLQGGLLHADQLTTVSPSFAREIGTPDGSFGMGDIITRRAGDLTGIVNGIGPEWDPSTDPHLPAHFSPADLFPKADCKRALQAELGLPQGDAPLFGSVGRLDPQKGTDLLIESVPWLVSQGAQIAMLGSAAPSFQRFEDQLRQLAQRFPQSVAVRVAFDEGLAHRIEAGADFFVMPSRFEPCGLNQLYALRYGTLPIVRRTGGLADTVDDAVGFSFDAIRGDALREACYRALHTPPQRLRQMRAAAMARDHGWEDAVGAYEAVYTRASARRS